jgi:uncharacterized protein YPO0396
MPLSPEQKASYENMLNVTRQEITDLDHQIEEELAKVKERLADLQNAKKASRQIYDGICLRLGIPNDLDEEGEDEF